MLKSSLSKNFIVCELVIFFSLMKMQALIYFKSFIWSTKRPSLDLVSRRHWCTLNSFRKFWHQVSMFILWRVGNILLFWIDCNELKCLDEEIIQRSRSSLILNGISILDKSKSESLANSFIKTNQNICEKTQ